MVLQCYFHDLSKRLMWSTEYIMNESITKFNLSSNSIEISLVADDWYLYHNVGYLYIDIRL